MTRPSVHIQPMPDAWFDRPQYSPRVRDGETLRWFALTEFAGVVREWPDAPPACSPPADLGVDPRLRRDAVAATYRTWDIPPTDAVERNIARLGDPDALVIATGQQAGFLTGPLYTIYKAISAISLADALSLRWSRPCIPLFWVASEDHDIDEIREARFPGPGREEVIFRLPHPTDRRPVGCLPVDAATEAVLDEAGAFFGGRRHGEMARELIGLYRGRGIAGGFAAIMARLFGARGLLVIDPLQLRSLAAPIYRRVVDDPAAVVRAVEEGARSLEVRGVRPFVAPRLPLFILRGGLRHHLAPDADGLRIDGGGPRIDPEEIERAIGEAGSGPGEDEARRRRAGSGTEESGAEDEMGGAAGYAARGLSSGALLRPLVQQAAFPCVATVCGPAEAGYFEQLGPLAAWLGIPRPRAVLRLQATLLEGRAIRAMRKLELDPSDIAAAAKAQDLVPRDAEGERLHAEALQLEEETGRVTELLARAPVLGEAARRRIERAAARMRSSASALREKLDRELRQGREEMFEAAESLWHHVFPASALQERRWSALSYIARYGTQWLDDLIEEVQSSPAAVRHLLVLFESDEP